MNRKTDVSKKWNMTVGSRFAEAPVLDGSDSVGALEKIFDLNQQLSGTLEQY